MRSPRSPGGEHIGGARRLLVSWRGDPRGRVAGGPEVKPDGRTLVLGQVRDPLELLVELYERDARARTDADALPTRRSHRSSYLARRGFSPAFAGLADGRMTAADWTRTGRCGLHAADWTRRIACGGLDAADWT